jgi:hypothetical protein
MFERYLVENVTPNISTAPISRSRQRFTWQRSFSSSHRLIPLLRM